MPYCGECGTEVEEQVQFCPECGTDLPSADTVEATTTTTTSGDELKDDGIDTGRAIASGVMGAIVGAVVAFAFTNFGGSLFLFLITLGGVGYFLYSRSETTKLAVGMGLYITALWIPLSPILFYIPMAGQANTGTAAGAGTAIGSIFGMVLYGFIGLIIGLVLAAMGYFVRKGEGE